MNKGPSVHVERVLPEEAHLSMAEADAILEVAYLTTAADGRLSDEEYESFRAVASKLRGLASGGAPPVNDAALNKMLEDYAGRSDHTERSERLRVLAKALGRSEVRDLAYKVAYAMSLCDLDAADDEADFDDELIAALDISEDTADALAGEVFGALDDEIGDEDEGEEDDDEDEEGDEEEPS